MAKQIKKNISYQFYFNHKCKILFDLNLKKENKKIKMKLNKMKVKIKIKNTLKIFKNCT